MQQARERARDYFYSVEAKEKKRSLLLVEQGTLAIHSITKVLLLVSLQHLDIADVAKVRPTRAGHEVASFQEFNEAFAPRTLLGAFYLFGRRAQVSFMSKAKALHTEGAFTLGAPMSPRVVQGVRVVNCAAIGSRAWNHSVVFGLCSHQVLDLKIRWDQAIQAVWVYRFFAKTVTPYVERALLVG